MKVQALVVMITVSFLWNTAHAQTNPFVGTWKTNISKSSYDPGQPPTAASVLKMVATPDGGVTSRMDSKDAQGKPTFEEYTAKYDGKDYPLKGSPNWDSVSLRRINENTVLMINKQGGQVIRMMWIVVSPDGKTRTVSGISASGGRGSHNISVFERQ